MRHSFLTLIGIVAVCAAAASAVAQTTYKCGNAYSETPCADGKSVVVQDQRTEEQKRQADENTARQREAADKFEKDRIAQEKRDADALRKAGSPLVTGKKAAPGVQQRSRVKAKILKPPKPVKPKDDTKKKPVKPQI